MDYRVETDYGVFVIRVDASGVVYAAAPIAKWTVGKYWPDVQKYYKQLGACTVLDITEG
jgi:hypothetical protein